LHLTYFACVSSAVAVGSCGLSSTAESTIFQRERAALVAARKFFQQAPRRPEHDAMTHWMTDSDKPDDQIELAVKPRTKPQRPPLYKVLMLNDDFTPMEFVVHVLERLFNMTHAQAIEIMLTVHRKGVAVVGVFSHEIAETKVAQVMELARRQQHPLQCTMEKE